MLPKSGPYTKTFSIAGPPTGVGFVPTAISGTRTYYRQKKPYNLNLEFNLEKYVAMRSTFVGYQSEYGYTVHTMAGAFNEEASVYASNKCYDKFLSEVSEQSQWANNLLEANKTLDAAVRRIKQLTTFTKRLKRFDFRGAALALGSPKPKSVSRRHKLGDNWLEYHFGWVPLVQDIGHGMEALTRDFTPLRVRARGRYIAISDQTSVSDHNYRRRDRQEIVSRAQMIAGVRINNPNTSLLSDLGFINPASVVWEAVPFSFVVDWFANVGQVLSSATDFVGKDLYDPVTTVFQTIDRSVSTQGEAWPYGSAYFYASEEAARSVFARRTSGITGPKLTLKPFKGFSVVRGATAIALLNSFLRR